MAKRPSPAQLRARRAFASRFGGKRTTRVAVKKASTMAKGRFKRFARAAGSRARGAVTRIRWKADFLPGVYSGLLVPRVTSMVGPIGAPVTNLTIGMMTGNPTLTTVSGMQAGAWANQFIPASIGGIPLGGGTSGGGQVI